MTPATRHDGALPLDADLLARFEAGLDPAALHRSSIPARLIGYGEISAIFVLDGLPDIAFKRMPLFGTRTAAADYGRMHEAYCRHLVSAGLHLPPSTTTVVAVPGRPVVLYIAQRRLNARTLAHRRLDRLTEDGFREMLAGITDALNGVWAYNARMGPGVEIGIDGQLSNWSDTPGGLCYIDTSTPLMRLAGREQLDPELLLQAAPPALRWLLRLFFVEDVVSRYYDPRSVLVDLVANLFKEQRPDLIPLAVKTVNDTRPAAAAAITQDDVRRYYREDRRIWQLFLAFRRLDRWRCRKRGRRYEFILPGKINR